MTIFCTAIGDGAVIGGPAMFGANCIIKDNVRICQSVIGDYTRISSIVCLEKCIVFAGKTVNPQGEAHDIEEADIGWIFDDARKRQAGNLLHTVLQLLAQTTSGAANMASGGAAV